MKKEVTLELRNKIRKDMVILEGEVYYEFDNDGCCGDRIKKNYCGILQFNNIENCIFKECVLWQNNIKSHFSCSYNNDRLLRVGRFFGIKPMKICPTSVEFSIVHYTKPSWKDWFVTEKS